MPIYEYECPQCGKREERIARVREGYPPPVCLDCFKEMVPMPTSAAIQFRGTGWTPKGPGRRV